MFRHKIKLTTILFAFLMLVLANSSVAILLLAQDPPDIYHTSL